MNTTEYLTIPGQYNIYEVSLISSNGFALDIRPQMVELTISEDIFNNAMNGHLIISESLNLIRHFPIVGNEKLRIRFNTPTFPVVEKEFSIYKISPRLDFGAQNSTTYTLYFSSYEMIVSNSKKISMGYKNLTVSEMATSIFREHLSSTASFYAAPTESKKTYAIPYMQPFECLNWLSSRAVYKENPLLANYLFYENFNGFFFVPINYSVLLELPSSSTYFTFIKGGSESLSLDQQMRTIEKYDVFSTADTLQGEMDGYFASSLLLHDITFKTYTYRTYSYNRDFYKIPHLETEGVIPKINEPYSQAYFSNMKYFPTNSYSVDDVQNNDDYERIVLNRNAQLLHFSQQIDIVISGDSRRRIGEIIHLDITTPEPKENIDDFGDPYLSGKYLITRIDHMINKREYKMKLRCSRDANARYYPDKKEIKS